MYRPTWRMDDRFKEYVEGIAQVTKLSTVQVARLAVFSAPFSAVFLANAAEHRKAILRDASLPLPCWCRSDSGLWLNEEREGEGRQEGIARIGTVVSGL